MRYAPQAPLLHLGGCRARGRGSYFAELSWDVLWRGALVAPCAQASASPQRYSARPENRLYGGPPPRVALVASVFGLIGKPAIVNVSAVWSRVKRQSGCGRDTIA